MSKINTRNLALELGVTLALCCEVGSPRALSVKLLIENEEWEQLLALECEPSLYHNQTVSDFADDYLVTELLSKSQLLPIRQDRLEAECISAFKAAESHNLRTNARLYGAKHPAWFHDVKAVLKSILGPLNRAALDKIVSSCGFGPGAVVGVSTKGGVVPSLKFDTEMCLTPNLIPFVRSLMGEHWWDLSKGPHHVVRGNKFFTVPKKAKKLRGCCKEPLLNQWFQTGIGSFIIERLRLFGVDLRSQGVNRRLAALAQALGLATIDLSEASNLNSRATVDELCTLEWSHLLNLARSPTTEIDGEVIPLAMHSSMGNGYTFPLETAIFYAVVCTCVPLYDRHLSNCYGDDIICPQYAANDVIDRLEYLGFKVNRRKTHLAGEFFESCGVDYFRGSNVRPFYLRRGAHDGLIPYELQIANRLRLYASQRLGCADLCDSRFQAIWLDLVRSIPKPWRDCKVPSHFGDTGIIVSRDEVPVKYPKPNSRHAQHEGRLIRFIRTKPECLDRQTYGVYLSGLRQPAPDPSYGREPIRGFLGKVVPSLTVSPWPSGLCWV